MEIINDTTFQIEALPFSGPDDTTVLTVIVKGTFEIRPGEPAVVTSEQLPILFGDEVYDDKDGGSVKFESDVAPYKPRADIVLVGKVHAPGGRPVQVLDVSLRVGTVQKAIRVIGDRNWVCSSRVMPEHFTKPQPFETMDIVYEHAFGGIDPEGSGFCEENLIGRGYFAKKNKKTLDGARLPNLEDPQTLIKSWKDHPKAVGFGFYGRAWMPRTAFLGTYDESWRKERSPNPPKDFKFEYYNGAHPDLQLEGYLKGNEEVELMHLSPEGKVQFRLPGIELSCIITKSDHLAPTASSAETKEYHKGADEIEPAIEEVALNLDTLCLIPEEKRLYLVWRGICPIRDLTALEVRTVEIR